MLNINSNQCCFLYALARNKLKKESEHSESSEKQKSYEKRYFERF